jgi:hypothetical protein
MDMSSEHKYPRRWTLVKHGYALRVDEPGGKARWDDELAQSPVALDEARIEKDAAVDPGIVETFDHHAPASDLTADLVAAAKKGDDLLDEAFAVLKACQIFTEKFRGDRDAHGHLAKRVDEIVAKLNTADALATALAAIEKSEVK